MQYYTLSAGLESALSAISVHVPESVDTLHKIFVSEAKPREDDTLLLCSFYFYECWKKSP
jgi:hypothetical protein